VPCRRIWLISRTQLLEAHIQAQRFARRDGGPAANSVVDLGVQPGSADQAETAGPDQVEVAEGGEADEEWVQQAGAEQGQTTTGRQRHGELHRRLRQQARHPQVISYSSCLP